MSTGSDRTEAPVDAVAWHDAECGAYAADLALWEELASGAGGPVMELGAGTGRVALHLAGSGHEVIAVERDPALAAELERRAGTAGSGPAILAVDLRELAPDQLAAAPALLIAPMHVMQTFDEAGRREILEACARLLAPGGAMALVLIDEAHSTDLASGELLLLPDVKEADGWVFASRPLWVQVSEATITARRLRERVAPDGQLERTVHDDVLHRTTADELERLGAELGLDVLERRRINTGEGESDSIVVLLEAS